MPKKRMNYYGRGANKERKSVNGHLENGAIFAARFAGSKVGKGSVIKADTIAIYKSLGNTGTVIFEQHKKGKTKYTKEEKEFLETTFPKTLKVERKFISEE